MQTACRNHAIEHLIALTMQQIGFKRVFQDRASNNHAIDIQTFTWKQFETLMSHFQNSVSSIRESLGLNFGILF